MDINQKSHVNHALSLSVISLLCMRIHSDMFYLIMPAEVKTYVAKGTEVQGNTK